MTFSPHGGAAPGAPLGAAAPPGTRGLPLSACSDPEVATTSRRGARAPPPRSASRARRVVGRCWADGAYAFAEDVDDAEDGGVDSTAEAWLAADGRPALADALRTPADAYGRTASQNDDAGPDDAETKTETESRPFAIVATAREPARFGGAPVAVRVVVGSAVSSEGGADVNYAVGTPEPTTYPSAASDSGSHASRGGWALHAESAALGDGRRRRARRGDVHVRAPRGGAAAG